MIHKQATLSDILGKHKIKLTKYNHSQEKKRLIQNLLESRSEAIVTSSSNPIGKTSPDTYSRSNREPESVGERQGNSSVCNFHTYRFYYNIRRYNDIAI